VSIAVARAFALFARTALALPFLAGCAVSDADSTLADPLKQRLLAREDNALQNLLLARTPADNYYAGAGGGSGRRGPSAYLDAPYDGPAVEPPLPDLNMLPEDMPPWEEFPEEPSPPPKPQPTPMQPVPTDDGSAPQAVATPAPEAVSAPAPVGETAAEQPPPAPL
jgi:hypothetical protein